VAERDADPGENRSGAHRRYLSGWPPRAEMSGRDGTTVIWQEIS
jgi:hypothetical protein